MPVASVYMTAGELERVKTLYESSRRRRALRPESREERERFVQECLTWERTPYHPHARVKGAGADCVSYIVQAAENAQIVEHIDLPYYSPQWHLHCDRVEGKARRELLLRELLKYCKRTHETTSGNLVIFTFAHAYSHTAIILTWPEVLHASMQSGRVERINVDLDPHLSRCKKLFFTRWECSVA